jgi:hypothetical protein
MILHIDTERRLALDTTDVIGQSIAVLGVTGSGKSNTVGVLAEELLSQGLPLTFVDPEGEMWGLRQRFQAVVVGRSEQAVFDVGPDHAAELATLSVERGLSIILDLSEHSQEEQEALLLPYLTALWAACTKARRPYVVAIEEAHEYLPQGGRTPIKSILTRLALRGRKRGLSLLLSSQRSAKVDKDVLTQTSLLFLHRVVHPVDMEVYKALIPLPAKEVESQVRALERGQAVVLVNHQIQQAHVRRRETFHPSSTPTLAASVVPELQAVDSALLAELREMLSAPNPAYVSKVEQAKLQARIRMLEEENQKLRGELEGVRGQAIPANLPPLQMPERLEIQQAVVHSVVATSGHQPALVVATEPTKALPAGELTPTEKQQLTLLRQRLKRLDGFQRRVLRVLAAHEGTVMDTAQLATWLYVQEKTVTSQPPLALVRLGLVARSKGRHGAYQYQSKLASYLRMHFPRLETEGLVQQLLAELAPPP